MGRSVRALRAAPAPYRGRLDNAAANAGCMLLTLLSVAAA